MDFGWWTAPSSFPSGSSWCSSWNTEQFCCARVLRLVISTLGLFHRNGYCHGDMDCYFFAHFPLGQIHVVADDELFGGTIRKVESGLVPLGFEGRNRSGVLLRLDKLASWLISPGRRGHRGGTGDWRVGGVGHSHRDLSSYCGLDTITNVELVDHLWTALYAALFAVLAG